MVPGVTPTNQLKSVRSSKRLAPRTNREDKQNNITTGGSYKLIKGLHQAYTITPDTQTRDQKGNIKSKLTNKFSLCRKDKYEFTERTKQ